MGRREFIALVCAGITWWQRWNFIDADRDVARLASSKAARGQCWDYQ